MALGLLWLAMPVMFWIGIAMAVNGEVVCGTQPSLPVCDSDTRDLVTCLPLAGAVVGAVIGVGGRRQAVSRERTPYPWFCLAWVPSILAVVLAGNIASTEPRGVESTTARAVRPGPVPADADTTRWVWHPPEDMTVGDLMPADGVVRGGAGVIVGVEDGVIALDGATGKERWHYRSAGGIRSELAASPDGQLVAFAMYNADTQGTVVLDAMTGERVGTVPGGMGLYAAMTNHTVTTVDNSETTVSGDDPHGRHHWEFTLQNDCMLLFATPNPVPSADIATVGMACGVDDSLRAHPPAEPWPVPVTVTLVGLDDRTGAERWRFSREGLRTADLTHLPGGTVLLEGDTSAWAIDPDTGAARVDTAVRDQNDPIPAPGAWVTAEETEIVGLF
ncbi:hypothetical protein BU204_35670 [Actinophytocola xanthii]|uniref:Pyrrolo-quinoline quinone repeat domain-containing protein n=1 Tax=Actinophytocola xanthii TaxID=1912961 RepID=A0A1Q8BZB6_9PSEU|nr:hypothetical protein BU204_35670 [Actinophytocola xanthii]